MLGQSVVLRGLLLGSLAVRVLVDLAAAAAPPCAA
jgi:hypothetical protein